MSLTLSFACYLSAINRADAAPVTTDAEAMVSHVYKFFFDLNIFVNLAIILVGHQHRPGKDYTIFALAYVHVVV